MYTPTFNLSQTDTVVTIQVQLPSARAHNIEFDVTDKEFRLSADPFFSVFTSLIHCFVMDGNVITLPKAHPNDHFEHFDDHAQLLLPPVTDDFSNEWFWEQHTPSLSSSDEHSYGFASMFSNQFTVTSAADVCKLDNPGLVPPSDRLKAKEVHEEEEFDSDHFLSDNIDLDSFGFLLDIIPQKQYLDWELFSEEDLNEEEIEELNRISKIDILEISGVVEKHVLLTLADVSFAGFFDCFINDGDISSESWWNISNISGVLSFFCEFSDCNQLLRSILRRSSCYGMIRNFKFINDILELFLKYLDNQNFVLKLLLRIRQILLNQDSTVPLVSLYLDGFISYVNQVNDQKFKILAKMVSSAHQKSSYSLDLDISEYLSLAQDVLDASESSDD
ncbi:hypothetical protein GEMRC1_009153 [Eukaryota sp. GEM-RC1]